MAATLCPAVPRQIPAGYLTVDDASVETGLSRRWLFALIQRGELPSYRVTGIRQTLVKRVELARLDEPKPRPRKPE